MRLRGVSTAVALQENVLEKSRGFAKDNLTETPTQRRLRYS